MSILMQSIRNTLASIIEDIDAGNSNLSDSEATELMEHLSSLTNRREKLSIYQACRYLKVSRATFDNYVREGKLPKGRKQAGFKELFYYKSDLDEYIDKYK